MIPLPKHLEQFAKEAIESHLSARAAVELLWERDMSKLVVALKGCLVALQLGPVVNEKAAIEYAKEQLSRLEGES